MTQEQLEKARQLCRMIPDGLLPGECVSLAALGYITGAAVLLPVAVREIDRLREQIDILKERFR